jgi:hypothetical protein
MILAMTRPLTSSKLLLIADSLPVTPDHTPVPVRRYRLARLRFEGRLTEPSRRFEHLKQVFD